MKRTVTWYGKMKVFLKTAFIKQRDKEGDLYAGSGGF
jgi:hypothetical protein